MDFEGKDLIAEIEKALELVNFKDNLRAIFCIDLDANSVSGSS